MTEQQRLSTQERLNLVAYLDGELGAVESLAIQTKLTQSVTARHEVENLERTWELLDYLPRPKVSQESMTRTLSLAADLDARGAHVFTAAVVGARQLFRVTAALFLVGVVFGLAYVGTRWIWPDSTDRLARDLSIAEQFDQYRDVGSFSFLQMLDESSKAFPSDAP